MKGGRNTIYKSRIQTFLKKPNQQKFPKQNISTLWSNVDTFNIDMFSLIQVKHSDYINKMLPLFNHLYEKLNNKEKEFIQFLFDETKTIDFVPYIVINNKVTIKNNLKGGGNENKYDVEVSNDRELNRKLQQHANDMVQSNGINIELQKSKVDLMRDIVKLMQDQQQHCHNAHQSNLNRKNMWLVFNLLLSGTIQYTTQNVVNVVVAGATASTIKFVNTAMGITGFFINPMLRFLNVGNRVPDGREIFSNLTEMSNYIKDDPEMQPLFEALNNTRLGINVLQFLILFIVLSFITFLVRMCFDVDNISFMGFNISTNSNMSMVNTGNITQMLQQLNLNNLDPQPHSQKSIEFKNSKGGHKTKKMRLINKKKNTRKKS